MYKSQWRHRVNLCDSITYYRASETSRKSQFKHESTTLLRAEPSANQHEAIDTTAGVFNIQAVRDAKPAAKNTSWVMWVEWHDSVLSLRSNRWIRRKKEALNRDSNNPKNTIWHSMHWGKERHEIKTRFTHWFLNSRTKFRTSMYHAQYIAALPVRKIRTKPCLHANQAMYELYCRNKLIVRFAWKVAFASTNALLEKCTASKVVRRKNVWFRYLSLLVAE